MVSWWVARRAVVGRTVDRLRWCSGREITVAHSWCRIGANDEGALSICWWSDEASRDSGILMMVDLLVRVGQASSLLKHSGCEEGKCHARPTECVRIGTGGSKRIGGPRS